VWQSVLRLKVDHPDGFTHLCKDCGELLKLTRHSKNKAWLTNKAELHIAKRHPDNKAAKLQRTGLKAKRVTHAQTIHESFQRGSDLSLGSNADRLLDAARIAQARYYVYGRGKISKETFDDEYFREMFKTQYAAGIAVATAAASARVTRSSAFAAHGGHGGASPAAPRSATAAPRGGSASPAARDGSASPAARSAGASPAARDGSASPAARDGSASPAARGAGASPAARNRSASSLVILGGGASPGAGGSGGEPPCLPLRAASVGGGDAAAVDAGFAASHRPAPIITRKALDEYVRGEFQLFRARLRRFVRAQFDAAKGNPFAQGLHDCVYAGQRREEPRRRHRVHQLGRRGEFQ
jgi:hypothetical protein